MRIRTQITFQNALNKFVFLRFVKILETYIEKGGRVSKGTSNIGVHIDNINEAFKKPFTATIDTSKDKIQFNTTTKSRPNSDGAASITIPTSAFAKNSSENESVYVIYYKSSKLFQPDFGATEVCTDGFSKRKTVRSTPVLAGSIRNRKVYNLSDPVKIRFRLPTGQVCMCIVLYKIIAMIICSQYLQPS